MPLPFHWRTLLAVVIGLSACSDPVYYPSLTAPLDGAGSDTGGGEVEGIDLTGVPCSTASPGPGWLYTVDNQHDGVVVGHKREADCSLSNLGTITEPGAFESFGNEGEIYVFTDEQVTVVLAWVEVLANDAATVVIP